MSEPDQGEPVVEPSTEPVERPGDTALPPSAMTTRIGSAPGEVRGGMRVRVFFEDAADDFKLPQAAPA